MQNKLDVFSWLKIHKTYSIFLLFDTDLCWSEGEYKKSRLLISILSGHPPLQRKPPSLMWGSKQPGRKKLPAEGNTDTFSKQILQIIFFANFRIKPLSSVKKSPSNLKYGIQDFITALKFCPYTYKLYLEVKQTWIKFLPLQ